MLRFEELYEKILKEEIAGGRKTLDEAEYDPHHLDCLLHPNQQPLVWRVGVCDGEDGCEGAAPCSASCVFDAIVKDDEGNYAVDPDKCNGCGECLEICKSKNLVASKDSIAAIKATREHQGPVYVMIAPAFLGQFADKLTPGQLRSAFKKLGFSGMIEVALFADILTLKEALEFDENIHEEADYHLTSCCCPMWIGLIRKKYSEMMPHVPASVSPMVAAGRAVKKIHPDALTVFIGPCMAKKAEAREPDIAGAVDYVLTFQEVKEIFDYANINPSQEPDDEKDHSSRAGRIYAYAGGVSEAVKSTVEKIRDSSKVQIRIKTADGVPACKEMMEELLSGNRTANFYEGMGCKGGCVGGPKVIIDKEVGRELVKAYGDAATHETPIDNPYVIELLKTLGFDTVESLLKGSDIFTRDFK